MAKSLFSQNWYRVNGLKPRLRGHAEIHRHHFRDQRWYVLQDHASGKFHRFSPAAYKMIGLMDGENTVQEIWEEVGRKLEDDVPTQDEVIQLLGQLHSADLLHSDVKPDVTELSHRSDKQRRTKILQSIKNPLALRLPLLDPDGFLTKTLPCVGFLFTRFGFASWLALVVAGLVLTGIHWSELTLNITDRITATQNILIMVFSYPVIKALHELGHGYAVKKWGGDVHEMGVMILVMMPVPYVDASAASAFRDKWKRAVVGGAGIMVEMAIACIALMVWLAAEPGIVRSVAFNVMLIGGVSTALFNGNPLLRFDGYFVMTDLIEIPNLGQRGNQFVGYLIKKNLFGFEELDSPVSARGEAPWFVFYSVSAFIYRFFIIIAIAGFVATKFFFVGVLLACWSVIQMYVVPTWKMMSKLIADPRTRRHRHRVNAVIGGTVAAIVVLLAFIPVPFGTVAEGVVWVSDRSVIHAGTNGFAVRVIAKPNSLVEEGEPLLEMEDPELRTRVRVLESELAELKHRFRAAYVEDRVEADIIRERIQHTEADLRRNRERLTALIIRSRTNGRFLVSNAGDLPGQFIRKGELVAYVVDFDRPVLRVVVPQTAIALVRGETIEVQVRFADRIDDVKRAVVEREVPTATEALPSRALSVEGGGGIQMDPTDPERQKVLNSLFQIDLRLSESFGVAAVGGRVYVRFDHGYKPIAEQVYRTVRQVFLSMFNV